MGTKKSFYGQACKPVDGAAVLPRGTTDEASNSCPGLMPRHALDEINLASGKSTRKCSLRLELSSESSRLKSVSVSRVRPFSYPVAAADREPVTNIFDLYFLSLQQNAPISNSLLPGLMTILRQVTNNACRRRQAKSAGVKSG